MNTAFFSGNSHAGIGNALSMSGYYESLFNWLFFNQETPIDENPNLLNVHSPFHTNAILLDKHFNGFK